MEHLKHLIYLIRFYISSFLFPRTRSVIKINSRGEEVIVKVSERDLMIMGYYKPDDLTIKDNKNKFNWPNLWPPWRRK